MTRATKNQKIQEAENFETSDSREDVHRGNNVQPVALIPLLRQINFFGEGGGGKGGELAKVTRPGLFTNVISPLSLSCTFSFSPSFAFLIFFSVLLWDDFLSEDSKIVIVIGNGSEGADGNDDNDDDDYNEEDDDGAQGDNDENDDGAQGDRRTQQLALSLYCDGRLLQLIPISSSYSQHHQTQHDFVQSDFLNPSGPSKGKSFH